MDSVWTLSEYFFIETRTVHIFDSSREASDDMRDFVLLCESCKKRKSKRTQKMEYEW